MTDAEKESQMILWDDCIANEVQLSLGLLTEDSSWLLKYFKGIPNELNMVAALYKITKKPLNLHANQIKLNFCPNKMHSSLLFTKEHLSALFYLFDFRFNCSDLTTSSIQLRGLICFFGLLSTYRSTTKTIIVRMYISYI